MPLCTCKEEEGRQPHFSDTHSGRMRIAIPDMQGWSHRGMRIGEEDEGECGHMFGSIAL